MNLKENIKKELRLVTEQSSNERCMHIRACWGGITHYRFGTVNGGIPQSGQILDWMQGNRPLYVHNVFTPGDPNEPSGCSGYNQNFNLYQGTTCCPHVCGTSTSNQMLGFAGFIPSMNYAGCSGSGPMCCGNSNYNASPNSNCPNTPTPAYVTVELCDGTPFGSQNSFMNMLVDDNGTVRTPVIGDEFEAPMGGPGSVVSNVRIIQVGTASPTVTPYTFPIVPCTTGTGCDPSAWPNHQTWITNWTSLPNFTSSNPNQPCNMICNKLQIWNNNLSGAGPVQTNQLNCKIEEGQNQAQIHNCNC